MASELGAEPRPGCAEGIAEAPSESMGDVGDRASGRSEAGGALSLLVVDDDIVVQKVAQVLLCARGHVVRCVGGGVEAVALGGGGFDGVLVDLDLPDLHGREVIARLRAGGYEGALVVLTASVDGDEIEGLRAAGADGVVGKPMDVEAVERLVRTRPRGRG